MKKHEIDFLESVANATIKCPNLAPIVTDTSAVFKACEDFSVVKLLGYNAITKFIAYCANEKYIGDDDYDQEFIVGLKVEAYENLKKLEEFISKRAAKGWE